MSSSLSASFLISREKKLITALSLRQSKTRRLQDAVAAVVGLSSEDAFPPRSDSAEYIAQAIALLEARDKRVGQRAERSRVADIHAGVATKQAVEALCSAAESCILSKLGAANSTGDTVLLSSQLPTTSSSSRLSTTTTSVHSRTAALPPRSMASVVHLELACASLGALLTSPFDCNLEVEAERGADPASLECLSSSGGGDGGLLDPAFTLGINIARNACKRVAAVANILKEAKGASLLPESDDSTPLILELNKLVAGRERGASTCSTALAETSTHTQPESHHTTEDAVSSTSYPTTAIIRAALKQRHQARLSAWSNRWRDGFSERATNAAVAVRRRGVLALLQALEALRAELDGVELLVKTRLRALLNRSIAADPVFSGRRLPALLRYCDAAGVRLRYSPSFAHPQLRELMQQLADDADDEHDSSCLSEQPFLLLAVRDAIDCAARRRRVDEQIAALDVLLDGEQDGASR